MSATSSHTYDSTSGRVIWATGVTMFAGTIMATIGVLQFFEGLSAILNDKVYVTTPDYAYQFDLTTWGWIHLVVGAVAVVVGCAILVGQPWALATGIFIAALSMLTNFLFMPYFPLWSIVIIAADVAIIWALSVRLSE
jgi:hypothetical protein